MKGSVIPLEVIVIPAFMKNSIMSGRKKGTSSVSSPSTSTRSSPSRASSRKRKSTPQHIRDLVRNKSDAASASTPSSKKSRSDDSYSNSN